MLPSLCFGLPAMLFSLFAMLVFVDENKVQDNMKLESWSNSSYEPPFVYFGVRYLNYACNQDGGGFNRSCGNLFTLFWILKAELLVIVLASFVAHLTMLKAREPKDWHVYALYEMYKYDCKDPYNLMFVAHFIKCYFVGFQIMINGVVIALGFILGLTWCSADYQLLVSFTNNFLEAFQFFENALTNGKNDWFLSALFLVIALQIVYAVSIYQISNWILSSISWIFGYEAISEVDMFIKVISLHPFNYEEFVRDRNFIYEHERWYNFRALFEDDWHDQPVSWRARG